MSSVGVTRQRSDDVMVCPISGSSSKPGTIVGHGSSLKSLQLAKELIHRDPVQVTQSQTKVTESPLFWQESGCEDQRRR